MGYKYSIDKVLEVGTDLFRKEGYSAVGINEILKASGIPKGSFYNFFKNKEDFVCQVIIKYGKNYADWIRGFMEDDSISPIKRIHSFYSVVVDVNEADEYQSGCFVNVMSNEIGRTHDHVSEALNSSFNGWIDIIACCIEEGQQKGEIRKDFSPEHLAEYLHAGTYGGFSRMKVTRNREYLDAWLKMSMAFIRG